MQSFSITLNGLFFVIVWFTPAGCYLLMIVKLNFDIGNPTFDKAEIVEPMASTATTVSMTLV